jgi:hypothetical protein
MAPPELPDVLGEVAVLSRSWLAVIVTVWVTLLSMAPPTAASPWALTRLA